MSKKKSNYFKKNQISKITLILSIILKATSVIFLIGFGLFMLAIFSTIDFQDPDLKAEVDKELDQMNPVEKAQATFLINLPNWMWQYGFIIFGILNIIPLIISIFSLLDLNKGNTQRAAILSLIAALIVPLNLPYLASSILIFYDK